MSEHFQALLEKAAAGGKQRLAMPVEYMKLSPLRQTSGMTRDAVPEAIIGAIAPQAIVGLPGRLVKLHLPNADIRYVSGFYSVGLAGHFLAKLHQHKALNRWDRLGKGRYVIQWSDPPGSRYLFSEVEYVGEAFPEFVKKIRDDVIALLAPTYGEIGFNYCVCNLYVDGCSGVNWHSDAEPHLVAGSPIACVSFGSQRVFSLAKIPTSLSQTPEPSLNVRLESGSLLVMAGATQQHFLHAISKEASVREPRFSLTFRVNHIDT